MNRCRSSSVGFMTVYAAASLLSAYLSFVVQPLLGKYILPWFGGTAAVWTACMLFFQAALFAGYSYAHWCARNRHLRRQIGIHLVVLVLCCAALPITPGDAWKQTSISSPILRIVALLAASVGLPFLSLAATSPLIQNWLSHAKRDASPYRLYSFSNAGSLLAIVSYPFLIEPFVPLSSQLKIWSWSYVLFVALCFLCAVLTFRKAYAGLPSTALEEGVGREPASTSPPGLSHRVLWLSLAGCGTLMLLATTNQLCLDIAVVPLLWIVPLGIYLLSFILCFGSKALYSRPLFAAMLPAALLQTCYVLYRGAVLDLKWQIISYSFTLFVCCMTCHGELVRLKPPTRYLTAFYLLISFGGLLGGGFVTLAAPFLFKAYWEYHLGLVLVVFLLFMAVFNDPESSMFHGKRLWVWALSYSGLFVLVLILQVQIRLTSRDSLAMARDFYGILRVVDEGRGAEDHKYTLMHGRIVHGFQYRSAERRDWPTSYFGPNSGVGLAIRNHPDRSGVKDQESAFSIGVIGLGAGTLGAYGREGDSIRFYEINPEVVRLAYRYFTYLKDSAADVSVEVGDARILIEKECAEGKVQQFDVLVVDAFSGDAMPVHLLTKECFRLYYRLLKPGGILALNISNRYFDLAPVIRGQAAGGMVTMRIVDNGDASRGTVSSEWALLTSNSVFLASPEVHHAISPWTKDDIAPIVWTDDFSNPFRLLRRRSE